MNTSLTEEEQLELIRDIELHNAEAERLVARAQDIVKTLLLMSGGALAVCANFFSTGINLYQHYKIVPPIQLAWISLTSSIIFLGLSLLVLIGRDDRFATLRARSFGTRREQEDVSPLWAYFAWGFGLSGIIFFFIGMLAFCWAAVSYMQSQT